MSILPGSITSFTLVSEAGPPSLGVTVMVGS